MTAIPAHAKQAVLASIDSLLDAMLAASLALREFPCDAARLGWNRAMRDLSNAQSRIERGAGIEALEPALGAIELASAALTANAGKYVAHATATA